MDCKQTQILLAPYILGDLDDDLLRCSQLQDHLRGCSECTEMYEGFQATIGFVLEHKAEFAQAFKKARARDEENAVLEALTERYSTRRGLFIKISAVAACLVLGFGLFFAVNHFGKSQISSSPVASSQQQNPVKIELIGNGTIENIPAGQIITASDELKTLRINGNRQMVLNIGTELSIEPYNLGCVVKLDKGEIYTEVEHDGKPFMVETLHGRAVITGTTFNIKANHNKMGLAVVEGSVLFESEKGSVNVDGGYESSIMGRMEPTRPVACNVLDICRWAKRDEINKAIHTNPPDIYFTKMLDLPVNFIPYRDLEKIDFESWIDEHREWFEREFPWTKRMQGLLAQEGTEVDTINLLIESGDLWRFDWPEYSRQRILSGDTEIIQRMASQYGVEIDELISGGTLLQAKQSSNTEAFERWLNAIDKDNDNVALVSFHAAAFLVNTRSIAWYAVNNDKVQVQDREQVLDLLTEQVKTVSNILEVLNQLLLVDRGKTVCSTAQYDEYIRKINDDISLMMEIEEKLTTCTVDELSFH